VAFVSTLLTPNNWNETGNLLRHEVGDYPAGCTNVGENKLIQLDGNGFKITSG
jgi:hypothetical protein